MSAGAFVCAGYATTAADHALPQPHKSIFGEDGCQSPEYFGLSCSSATYPAGPLGGSMSNRPFAAAACVAAVAALAVPAGLSSAAPVSPGGTKVAPKSVVAAKAPAFKVAGAAKSTVPAAKAAKSVKVSP